MSITASDTIAVLLAAGRSRRFGTDSKLLANLNGKPVIAHAAAALAAIPFARRVAVTAAGGAAPAGFEALNNPNPERGLGHSLAVAAAAAHGDGAAAILVALADMPLVPTRHFTALLDGFDLAMGTVATAGAGGQAMVPAVFGAGHLDALARLDGDRGAQALLRTGPVITLDPTLLLDIDRPADLAAAAAHFF